MIPPTVRHMGLSAAERVPGAAELGVHLYVIRELNQSVAMRSSMNPTDVPFSKLTAVLLDIGADRLIRTGQAPYPVPSASLSGGGPFALLARTDRLRAAEPLDRLEFSLHLPPPPYRNNPALVQVMMNSIHQLTLFGYYSEWYGYGSTRLPPAADRRLEGIPPGWIQTGYPGPAFGYRDLRGFVLKRSKGGG
ncbi:gluconate 2-dehydrogenase subunit 3 family protein [Paenibacillus sp. P25]|nr:gluconate 2-dehydrogenase subunit 3 family protein [Paenibacillus sp. P25]